MSAITVLSFIKHRILGLVLGFVAFFLLLMGLFTHMAITKIIFIGLAIIVGLGATYYRSTREH